MAGAGFMAPEVLGATGAVDPIKAFLTTGSMEGSIAGAGGGASGAVGGPGLFGSFKGATEALKPFGSAAQTAMQVNGLLGGGQQGVQPSPMMQQTGIGSQTLGQLAQAGQQGAQQEMMAAEQARRQRRNGLLGGV